jgi:hypothetical protein
MVPPLAPSFCARQGSSWCASRAGKLPFGGKSARLLARKVSFASARLSVGVGGRGLRPGPQLLGVRSVSSVARGLDRRYPLDCMTIRSGQVLRSAGRINEPRPALVEAGFGGTPKLVNRQGVALVREEWRVVDRWWTEEPVSRRYFDVVLESGQNAVVFRDEERGGWFSQKA